MLNPKYVTIGKDVKKIEFKKDKIIKYFKNKEFFNQTLDFYNKYNFDFIPKLISYNKSNNSIIQENVGDLLSLKNNIPDDWENQLNNIRKEFIKKNMLIQDLRFLPYTPIVFNNITVKNNKIYIVDLTMVISSNKKYIDYKFDNIIKQIKFNRFIIKYINKYFLVIPQIFYHILWLIFDW